MFSVLQSALQKIATNEIRHDASTEFWIQTILEMFSEVRLASVLLACHALICLRQMHQINHDINKIFAWLLSESKAIFEKQQPEQQDNRLLQVYLSTLLSALKMAIARKQSIKGLEELINDIKGTLKRKFKMTDLGNISWFLGIEFEQTDGRYFHVSIPLSEGCPRVIRDDGLQTTYHSM